MCDIKMENKLSFVRKLSLEEMALRRIVVNLWSEPDILKWIAISILREDRCNDCYEVIDVERVKRHVSILAIPESFKKRMMAIVKPIGLQICRWKSYHEPFLIDINVSFCIDVFFLTHLCWTSAGTIDNKKTAEKLVCLETLDVVVRYKLASLYCLVDLLPAIWEDLPREYKWPYPDVSPYGAEQLHYYWNNMMDKEEEEDPEQFHYVPFGSDKYRRVFECSAERGNKAAAEYFFQKLFEESDYILYQTVSEVIVMQSREILKLPNYFQRGKLEGDLSYLLSMLSPEQQMQVLEERSCEILICFLDWPMQDFYLDIADVLWRYIPESRYDDLQYKMMQKIIDSDYHPNWIQTILSRSPRNFIKHFVEPKTMFRYVSGVYFFPKLCLDENIEALKVIFRNADSEDRFKLISCWSFFEVLYVYINDDKWHIVEVCLRETKLSEEDKERFKDVFVKHVKDLPALGTCEMLRGNPKWKQFFEFIDGTHSNVLNKRGPEEETPPPTAKKLRCEEEREVSSQNVNE